MASCSPGVVKVVDSDWSLHLQWKSKHHNSHWMNVHFKPFFYVMQVHDIFNHCPWTHHLQVEIGVFMILESLCNSFSSLDNFLGACLGTFFFKKKNSKVKISTFQLFCKEAEIILICLFWYVWILTYFEWKPPTTTHYTQRHTITRGV